MDKTPVVTVFLRHNAEVLLLCRSEAVGTYTGRWGAVAGHAEGDPEEMARREIPEETGIDPDASTTLVRRGDPFTVTDPDLETQWVVHPFLFACETRTVESNEETADFEWVPPTAILRRGTVPDLWTSYDRVCPRIETIATDHEHGSAYLSVRALEILRNEAALAATAHPDGRSWEGLCDLARELVAARPSMPVVRNRVDRTVSSAIETGATPAALESAASEEIDRALAADGDAAAAVADRLQGARVATLSRSGTVTAALERADPEAVLVAVSRPGGEGVAVASDLADRLGAGGEQGDGVGGGDGTATVTLTTDAAFAHQLATWEADAVLVGADAVGPGGRVVNKVGTRSLALAASHEGIPVLVVAASDKLATGGVAPGLEERAPSELTDDERVAVANPTFDVTPPDAVDAVLTERGALDRDALADLTAEYRRFASWRHDEGQSAE